jgi:hypothetical protein
LIDASKAFDKIYRVFLWDKLIDKIRPVILLSLMSYYEGSCAFIENCGEISIMFITTRGVKQGGPLSPRLFAIYVEDIVEEIEDTNSGVEINAEDLEANKKAFRIDIIMYADDIALLSNSIEGLNRMLKVTENYGNKWEIKFNPSKTVYLGYGVANNDKKRPVFEGVEIERVKVFKYLGIMINDKMSNTDHINKRLKGTFARIRNLEDALDLNQSPSIMKTFIYNTYARPILYYGLETLVLNKTEKIKIKKTESGIIKHMLGLRKCSKSTELLFASGLELSEQRLDKFKCSFFDRLNKNEYTKQVIESIKEFYKKEPEKVMCKKSLIQELMEIAEATIENIKDGCLKKIDSIIKEVDKWLSNTTVKKIRNALEKENFEELQSLTYVNFSGIQMA